MQDEYTPVCFLAELDEETVDVLMSVETDQNRVSPLIRANNEGLKSRLKRVSTTFVTTFNHNMSFNNVSLFSCVSPKANKVRNRLN